MASSGGATQSRLCQRAVSTRQSGRSLVTYGFDGSIINGLQSVENWRNYFEPKGATLGLFNVAYPISGLCAIPFISSVSDTFGRRAGLITGATICIIGATLQAAAQSLPMFVVARGILLGCGTVFLGSSGAPLITEIAHLAHRATATALFNTSYALGAIGAAWTTFGTFRIASSASWRILSGMQGLPSIIQLIGLYFVPERPRWLVSKDRNEEALAFLAKYHAAGNDHDPLVQFEYNEIRDALAYERSTDRGSWLQNYLEFTRTSGNRKRLFRLLWCACTSQMSGNAFISYYLSPVLTSVGLTSSLEQTLINTTQQVR